MSGWGRPCYPPDVPTVEAGLFARLLRSRACFPVLIAFMVLAAYAASLFNGWVNWDDQKNFLTNPNYRGLASENVTWMFTTFLLGHYHPLTWLTLGLDYSIWGMNPFGYHLTSVLLHTANAVLLYGVICAVLRLKEPGLDRWPALAGALFYALHPLRVESVVWITERRDVLCGFFTLLTLLAYLKRAAEQREGRDGTRWLLLACAAFAASLLSKALSIMLPAVLLLMDVYPLDRFKPGARWRILLEKVPFGVLSLVDAIVMVFAMRNIDAVRPMGGYNVAERAAQAAYGLCFYLVKTLWPSGLIPIYRLEQPMNPGALKYVAAMIAVAAITALLLVFRRRLPAVLAAWLGYVILVLPVLGVAVTGMQIAADRYTYLSLIPLALLVAGGLQRLDPVRRTPAMSGSALVLGAFLVVTVVQTRVWKDPISLWNQQLRFDPTCDLAYSSRGSARYELGDWKGAIEDCDLALTHNPRSADAFVNRGLARVRLGDLDGAAGDFEEVVRIDPRRADGYTNRGIARIQRGDYDGAQADLTEALKWNGQKAEIYAARGSVRAARGDLKGAVEDFESALKSAPGDWAPRADITRKLGIARRQLR